MAKMLEEQRLQGQRLSALEGRDGQKWRKVAEVVGTVILTAAVTAVLMLVGLK